MCIPTNCALHLSLVVLSLPHAWDCSSELDCLGVSFAYVFVFRQRMTRLTAAAAAVAVTTTTRKIDR